MKKYQQVEITDKAAEVVRKLKEQHGEVIFHQSGGCCDGTAPMMIEKEDFYLDDSDIYLGELEGVPYYMSEDMYDIWKYTHITVDVTEGRGSTFSLEIPLGLRFIIHSRIMTGDEAKSLGLSDNILGKE
jgi:uncharacterized protein (DUF779 family)